eukprot:3976139-Karenia_brevis.AAC.1
MPHGGWHRPSEQVQRFIDGLSPSRQLLLSTRGVLGLKLSIPAPPVGDTFEWLYGCTNDIMADATWYIDGSLFDGNCGMSTCRATGFGVVVASPNNDLIAYGRGIPPCWVKDAAGAEAWAFAMILRMCPELPHTATDCLNIVSTLSRDRGKATAASSPLARIWVAAFSILDDFGCTAEDLAKVKWIPAHTGQGSIGQVVASDSKPLTALQWRANRLADLLAKSAARPHRLPLDARKTLKIAREALEYSLAKLGAVTHAANNCKAAV